MAVEQPASSRACSGLSAADVDDRRRRGLVNRVEPSTSRSYTAIVREDVFTFINNILLALCGALFALGEVSDAVVAGGVVLGNVLVSVVQEVRAKRALDRIAVLTRPRAAVIRDGREQAVDPAEVVQDDVLVLRRGDQVVVDGPLLEGRVELDESLLTGESDLVSKTVGQPLHSGSFCVTGAGRYSAERIGKDSLANRLTTSARRFRRVLTPLQHEVNVILRVILLIALLFEVILLVQAPIFHLSVIQGVKESVVIAKLVPAGLFLSISLAYALGALRIARQGALVQEVNAVESLSNVDVLCLDKTGTLTANRLRLQAIDPIAGEEASLRTDLGNFAASVSAGNKTTEAIALAVEGRTLPVIEEVPFSSERRWSGVQVSGAGQAVAYVLGAIEVLRPAMELSKAVETKAETWSREGMRVLLFAQEPAAGLHDSLGTPVLPRHLVPLGLISFADELRPEAAETLARFKAAGVAPKIISGDNPETVAALARQAGVGGDLRAISGKQLEEMDETQRAEAAEAATIFGRIAPQQKEELIRLLRSNGHYVAMIGDGINDVLSLKAANLGIAMETGSQATRAVADIVLLGDSFQVLPAAVEEGQRIRNGLRDVLKLFLTRVLSVSILIMSVMILGGFPFDPKDISVLTTLTVGIPSVALAAWSRPGQLPRGPVTPYLLHFILPASFTIALAGIGVYAFTMLSGYDTGADAARTAITVMAVPSGLLLLPFVEPPAKWWVGGDELGGGWRPTLLAGVLLLAFIVLQVVPALRSFFGLRVLSAETYAVIAGIVIVWFFLLRYIWRRRLMERFLGIRFPGVECA